MAESQQPSWIQNLMKRAAANVSVSAENLVLKLDDGEVVLSAAMRSLKLASADPNHHWQPAWRELFGPYQVSQRGRGIQWYTVVHCLLLRLG